MTICYIVLCFPRLNLDTNNLEQNCQYTNKTQCPNNVDWHNIFDYHTTMSTRTSSTSLDMK